MEKVKQTPQKENPFRDFLDAVTVPEYNEARKEIIKRCKITHQVFRNWKNGYSAVPELAKPIINEIAGTTQTYKDAIVFTIEK